MLRKVPIWEENVTPGGVVAAVKHCKSHRGRSCFVVNRGNSGLVGNKRVFGLGNGNSAAHSCSSRRGTRPTAPTKNDAPTIFSAKLLLQITATMLLDFLGQNGGRVYQEDSCLGAASLPSYCPKLLSLLMDILSLLFAYLFGHGRIGFMRLNLQTTKVRAPEVDDFNNIFERTWWQVAGGAAFFCFVAKPHAIYNYVSVEGTRSGVGVE